MAIIGRKPKFDGSNNWMGIDTSAEGRVYQLHLVLRSLESYAPAEPPGRPADLELSDQGLREASAKKRRGGRLTKAEKDALSLLGTWRGAVRRIEVADAGNLIMLLGLLNVAEAAGLTSEASQLREFALARYKAPIPGPPAPSAVSQWAERWSDYYSQNRRVLPLALRTLADVDVVVDNRKDEEAEYEAEF